MRRTRELDGVADTVNGSALCNQLSSDLEPAHDLA